MARNIFPGWGHLLIVKAHPSCSGWVIGGALGPRFAADVEADVADGLFARKVGQHGDAEETGFFEQYLRQNEKCLNCHCEGGLGGVNLDVNRYAPPWQSHNLTVGLRLLRKREGYRLRLG